MLNGKALKVMAAVAVGLLMAAQARAASVWVEGESANIAMVQRDPAMDNVKKSALSGEDWVSNYGAQRQGVLDYRFQAPRAGEFTFYLRANAVRASLSYRLNGGDWTAVDMTKPLDVTNVAEDGKDDLRSLAWLNLGKVTLEGGVNKITFRMDSPGDNHGAIDCFLFTTDEFTPNGSQKPAGGAGEMPTPPLAQGTWPFEPGRDAYSPNALLDLRSLNEKEAGEHGFIKLTADGNDFALGDGQPIRFWAANTSIWESSIPDLVADHARFLAKRGVNLVRWHGNITPKAKSAPLTDFDKDQRDKLWRYVAAMKKEGIYMTISPYWAASVSPQPSWGLPLSGQKDMQGLLFFEPKLQAAYKQWLRDIYEPVNPYTGVALKDEPAVAIIQIQNEDSLLFWTVGNLKGGDLDMIGRQFGDWLTKKYGSLAKASQAWQNAKIDGDNLSQGLVRFYNIWDMTQPQDPAGGKNRRLSDQLEFWTETMYNFNKDIESYLRNDIGCRQLINAGNWKTADPVLLNDCERYAYTANEITAVNRYVTDAHIGPNNGWAIQPGDRFQDRSILTRPGELAVSLKQVEGCPMLITESTWVPPLSHQSEGPFLISVFQSLGGVDAYYWFCFGAMADNRPQWPGATGQWVPPGSANGFMANSLQKWVADTPEILGNFPAAALLFRKGYVEEGKPAVQEFRSLQDMWDRKAPIIAEEGGYDPNRDQGNYAIASKIKYDVDRLAFLVGPVEVTYNADPARNSVIDLSKYIDKRGGTVRSDTGQIEWNYAEGVCTLNAPKAKGVTGFLNKVGSFDLDGVSIASANDYATVLVVSMDDKPLDSSGKVLVQCGTSCRPTGWQQAPATWEDKTAGPQQGYQIVSVGKAPWQVIANSLAVSVKNPSLTTATVLDMNGMPRGQVKLDRKGDTAVFTMPPDAMYVVLQ